MKRKMDTKIIFKGKVKELADFSSFIKNRYPNWTLYEYIKEVEKQNAKKDL